MNKSVKLVLLIVGIILIGYGIYTMIMPESSVDLAVVEVETQDNTNSYISIGLGLAALIGSFLGGKK